jgi:hypothetical protein
MIYAQNLSLENRGILAAAILYPQLAIGLFSFGLLRSIPIFLKTHLISGFTSFQLGLCIFFTLSSILFLWIMNYFFAKPIFNYSYFYPVLSASSTIIMLIILARGKEAAYNFIRIFYQILLISLILHLNSVEKIIQSMIISNFVIIFIGLTFIKFKTNPQILKYQHNDITKGLISWSVITTINSNALLLFIDFLYSSEFLAVITVSLSYFRLQNLYVSSVAILSFFRNDLRLQDIYFKILISIMLSAMLLTLSPLLIKLFYGENYFDWRILLNIFLYVTISSINEILSQKFYKIGNLRIEIIVKLILIIGALLIYVLSNINSFVFSITYVLIFFTFIECLRFTILTQRGAFK